MEFPIVTTDALFVDLLNNACTNPAYIKVGDNTFGKKAEEGFASYRVETCCVAHTYIAKAIERDPDGLPTKYVVNSVEYENC